MTHAERQSPRRLLLALALAVALAFASCSAEAAAPKYAPPFQRVAGNFYAVSGKLPRRPGVLLRYQPFTTGLPPGGKAWRILYTTRRANGSIGPASGLVLVPSGAGSSPLPVIAYGHGTSGIAQPCAPSLLGGRNGPFYSGIPAVEQVVKRGWAIVAPDYTGLGAAGPTSNLNGPAEARSMLDAVRAARRLPVASLSDSTIAWGYSQGGHAALWAGALAPSYAPDVKLSGVAAMAPATEPGAFLDRAEHNPVIESFYAYTLRAFETAYPDVHMDRYVSAGALDTVRAIASKCLGGSQTAPEYLESLPDEPWPFTAPLTSGALGRRLAQNTPTRRVKAPVFVAQGLADELVLPDVQQRWMEQRCAAGQSMEYRTYPGRRHTTLDDEDSPLIGDLFSWTSERFEGRLQAPGCTTAVD